MTHATNTECCHRILPTTRLPIFQNSGIAKTSTCIVLTTVVKLSTGPHLIILLLFFHSVHDPDRSFCDAPEQTSLWYAHFWENRSRSESQGLTPFVAPKSNDCDFERYANRDVVLTTLLSRFERSSTVNSKQKTNSWISKYSFSKETIQDAEDETTVASKTTTNSPKKKKQTSLPTRSSPRKPTTGSPKKEKDSIVEPDSAPSPSPGRIPRKTDKSKENRPSQPAESDKKSIVKQEHCQTTNESAAGQKRKSPQEPSGKNKSSKPNSGITEPINAPETIDLLDSDTD